MNTAISSTPRPPSGTPALWPDVVVADCRTERSQGRPLPDDFIATLAHELGTPLSAISCAAKLMSRRPEAEVTEQAAALIERNVRHISRLVANLLAHSSLTNAAPPLAMQPVNLCGVLRDAIGTVEHEILQRSHTLRVVLPAASIYVKGDATRLRQAFINLIVNAARYTDDGGRLFVSAEAVPDGVCVHVRDSGAGIEADALPRVFDLFYRGVDAIRRHAGGHGIGLAVVGSVVAAHGGTVSVLSAGRGRGSDFSVTLPA
jgi:signal transduction histidine kinase